jgi:glutamine amidotransferase
MCELMAMSSKLPTTVTLSLTELARHGGGRGPHKDGWGIAYAMARDFRIIKEPQAAADSACVRYIQANQFTSTLVLSHIRRATYPKVLTFENTHPFDRELFGRRFVFAHNGHLPGIEALAAESGGRFRPLGETDSEQAFCAILNRLAARVPTTEAYDPRALMEVLQELGPRLLALGRCNFLLSDGVHLFAYGDHSLYSLTRTCETEEHLLDSGELRVRLIHEAPQTASLVATVPLTQGEDWRRFERGEIRVFAQGRELAFLPSGAAA